MSTKRAALIILDGWGYGKKDQSDAIFNSKKDFFDSLIKTYPNAKLDASGTAVGLPAGQMGNSEVGHMNLGAGRVVYQELGRIHKAVEDKEFYSNAVIQQAFEYAKKNNKSVHFMGLVSEGGVHSHSKHLKGLCDAANDFGLPNVFIHAFLDGRDTDPHSGIQYVEDIEKHIASTNIQIASVIGRYYAMDRDKRWERVKLAYDLLVKGEGKKCTSSLQAIQESYDEGVTDEFVKPVSIVGKNGTAIATINAGDVVFCFNFRTDRGREITMALSQTDFPEQGMQKLPLHYVTMTSYDETFKDVNVVFMKDDLSKTLGEILEQNHKTQIRIAETEKYPHVTFFFSGGREKEFEGEKRILIPSPKVATYDLQPEMSAQQIADAICPEMDNKSADFICLNFANTDMVGHTGVYTAVQKAVETVDACLQQVVECGIKNGYSFIILADHGNSDFMINDDGSPNTAHTTNLVPCILIDEQYKSIKDGKLGDVAPTLLKIMGVDIPTQMTGNVLV